MLFCRILCASDLPVWALEPVSASSELTWCRWWWAAQGHVSPPCRLHPSGSPPAWRLTRCLLIGASASRFTARPQGEPDDRADGRWLIWQS